jgi:cytochrome c peroxidase
MRTALALSAAAVAAACGGGGDAPPPASPWVWSLPAGFAAPSVPPANPMSEAKVALGRRLFYDRRLSGNGTQSCGSCHLQALAFTDGRAVSTGSTGQPHRRSAMALANVAYARTLTWANSLLGTLESQALVPMLGENPVELGSPGDLLTRLLADPAYPALFAAAFPGKAGPWDVLDVVRAIAAFERTLVSGDSPYDRFARGDPSALSAAAQRGLALFRSDRLRCAACHSGFAFMEGAPPPGAPPAAVPYRNTGLYDEDGLGAYPASDTGLADLTGDPADMGKFRVPSLRNVAVTAPYMHDGSVATLGDAVDAYAAGGRSARLRGKPSPLRDPLVSGFSITPEEKADLVAFLESLTDRGFLSDPRFSDPFAP